MVENRLCRESCFYFFRETSSSCRQWNICSSNSSGSYCRLMIKPTKWHVRPAKTQISLGIRRVWSESSLSAWRKLGSLATHWAHSEDFDQTGRMPGADLSLHWAHSHFVGFVMRRPLIYLLQVHKTFSGTTLSSSLSKVFEKQLCNSNNVLKNYS